MTRLVQVAYDLESSRFGVALAHDHEQIVAAVALHPNEAPKLAAAGTFDDEFDQVAELAADPRVRAVGETGLDHFRTGPDGRASQEMSFRRHIALAKALDKTLVIHDRDAHEDVVRVLLDEGAPARVVFHCFSGGTDLGEHCARHGWFMSFSGTGHLQVERSPSRGSGGCPCRAVARRDRRAVLGASAAPGSAERVVPRPRDASGDGRSAGGRAEDALSAELTANTERAFGQW